MAVSLDLAVVLSAGVGAPTITREDLETMFDSAYCFRDSWVTRYVASRRQWLTDEALDWVLTQGKQALESSLGDFPGRAERYAELAALAALHGRDVRAEELLTLAAENLLAHGYHKDTLFHHVLGAVSAYQRERPVGERHASDHAAQWACRLAPPIAKVTEFTDGDHTRHLPQALADTLTEVAPELLPSYYQWLAEEEEYYDAMQALEIFVRTADLTNPVAQAIAQTATDDVCVRVLAERSRAGDKQASEALAALTAIMGQGVATERTPEARPTKADHLHEGSQVPPVDEYPPERLRDFLTALQAANYWRKEEALVVWAEQWAARGRGREAYDVLLDASKRGHTSSTWAAIYRLAARFRSRDDAYNCLVRAYREAHGWNTYWASNELASNYWDEVRTHHPTQWANFLSDTIIEDSPSRGAGLGHSTFERLVMYCMLMGQRKLAGQLVEEMVNRSLELVSPLQFPTPGWVSPEQST
jgi:hypothetical protein